MGQQQLLLIVLTVIIVGIAVVVGINMFSASSTSANRDAVISDLTNLGTMAQQYYRKPTALAGGGNSFVGWWATVPTSLKTTANGTYAETSEDSVQVVLTGTGTNTGKDGTSPVYVKVTIAPNSVSVDKTTLN